MLCIKIYLLFILEFFKKSIILINFLTLILLEFNIKCFRFLVNSSIKILIVICKLLLLILFHPVHNLIFHILLFFFSSIQLTFSIATLSLKFTSFKSHKNMLIVFRNIKTTNGGWEFILICKLKSI